MKTIILTFLSLRVCQAQTPSSDLSLRQKVVAGSMGEQGVCHCSLAMEDVMFPIERMEFLETSNHNLSLSFQKEIEKIQGYQHKLDNYLENIKNLTSRVELCDKEGVIYNPLDFELLKLEISEVESLVMELRSSFTGSNVKMEALYMEVQNISALVNQLESHDKTSILKFRRDISSLQKRLSERKQNHSPFHMQFDTCKHGRILNISKPQIVQVNWRGTSYKTGGWGKDTFYGSTQELHWVLTESSYFNSVRCFNNFNDLKQYKNYKDRTLSMYGRGSGLTLYNNNLYYNCYDSELCKFSLDTTETDRKTIPEAVFNNRFPYASSQNQDIDLEGDELGLWVLYTKEGAQGDMSIGLLNETSLDLISTWPTSVYKPGATNAFIVCGVMYVTRALNTREEEIFYMYDTNTGEEHKLNIKFEKILETVQSLSYNANDRKLYMYNDGFEVIYNMQFQPLA